MSILYLIVQLGGERVALAAADVESVIEIDTLTPVPRAPAHISGLSALRSRVLTVMDCAKSLQLDKVDGSRTGGEAVVVTHDGHPYALLVDAVEDVVEATGEIAPIASNLAGGWSRAAQGMIEADNKLMLLLDIKILVAGPGVEALC
ncbi:chemotaxis protein CheW [Sphingosinicella rhizophila]|uniref:Chemotaxis protein CheW n=1 Tax=Sphingosinicella rhizophila TaxID=3050082 RepID=A0ABU3Q2B4_9SPHN|nr:chemotaxis protein CheW [Sphingosinicella sp. GR2756]MDT9597547.1 chemotaxis protein CheW [Sphingosinicella sp. GR2756]